MKQLTLKKAPVLLRLLILVVAILASACLPLTQQNAGQKAPTPGGITPSSGTKQQPPTGISLLPGQQIWKNGVSSYLFGTNDTEEWTDNNVQTNTAIQQYLKDGRFTLMRTFFFHNSIKDHHEVTDQEIQERINTVTNTSMQCLGVIPDIKIETTPAAGNKYTDLGFAEHLVSLLDGTHPGFGRCNMYEIGNEPDLSDGNNAPYYVQRWNTFVKPLKRINPNAKFMGPVSYTDNMSYIQRFLQGTQTSGLLPDAVTFHHYGCSGDPAATCLQNADNYETVINNVRSWVKSAINRNLPIGLTEWNMDPGSNTKLANDQGFMRDFTTRVLKAMIRAHLDFANQFDAMSYSGYGTLDMFDIFDGKPYDRSTPRAQYYAVVDMINQYKT